MTSNARRAGWHGIPRGVHWGSVGDGVTQARSALLDPRRAPLDEVALTIQFEALPGLLGPELGRFWATSLRSEFPKLEQHHPIDQILELERSPFPQPAFRLSTDPPPPRYFFVTERGTELVQVQCDRLSFNWRRTGDTYSYPHYPALREKFEQCVAALAGFVEREKLGAVVPNQCEILYANHVSYVQSELPHRHVGTLIKPWPSNYALLGGADFEDLRIHARHVLRNEGGAFIGRIHVNLEPAYLVANATPIYKIQLTGRGRPFSDTIQGAFQFLDFAHEKLRAAFSELIEDDVQREWMEGR